MSDWAYKKIHLPFACLSFTMIFFAACLIYHVYVSYCISMSGIHPVCLSIIMYVCISLIVFEYLSFTLYVSQLSVNV